MGGGTLLVIAIAYVLVLPYLPPLRFTREIAQVINDNGGHGAPGYMIDFKEPSLAFEQGGGLREQSDSNYLNTTPAAEWPQWIVTTDPVWTATRDDVRRQWDVIGTVTGLAYSDGGKRHEVIVLRRSEAH